MGIFERDERGARYVINVRFDGRLHLRDVEKPALSRKRELHPGKRRGGACFEQGEMRPLAADHLVAAPRARQDGELIAHRAGGDEEGRLFADQPGDGVLELAHGGILAVHVVPHFGTGHRLPHGRRGTRYGVGTKVDHTRILSPARRRAIPIRPAARKRAPATTLSDSHCQTIVEVLPISAGALAAERFRRRPGRKQTSPMSAREARSRTRCANHRRLRSYLHP